MQTEAKHRSPRADSCRKVPYSRNRRMRGLWQRNGHYYANLIVAPDLGSKTSRFVPLKPATLDEAKADYDRLLTERDDDRLRPLGLTPTVADCIVVYTWQLKVSGKRATTAEKEKSYLNRWSGKIGQPRFARGTSRLACRLKGWDGRVRTNSRSNFSHPRKLTASAKRHWRQARTDGSSWITSDSCKTVVRGASKPRWSSGRTWTSRAGTSLLQPA